MLLVLLIPKLLVFIANMHYKMLNAIVLMVYVRFYEINVQQL